MWGKPDVNFVKVNLDASLDVNKKRKGMGIIIRDEKGEALVATCDQRSNVQQSEVA